MKRVYEGIHYIPLQSLMYHKEYSLNSFVNTLELVCNSTTNRYSQNAVIYLFINLYGPILMMRMHSNYTFILETDQKLLGSFMYFFKTIFLQEFFSVDCRPVRTTITNTCFKAAPEVDILSCYHYLHPLDIYLRRYPQRTKTAKSSGLREDIVFR